MKFLTKSVFLCTILLFGIFVLSVVGIFINKHDTFSSIIPNFIAIISAIVTIIFSILGMIISTLNEKKGILTHIETGLFKQYKYSVFYRNLIIFILAIPLIGIFLGMLIDWFIVLPAWLGLK